MELDPRHSAVRTAQIEFLMFWVTFMEKHDLTMAEFLTILTTQTQSIVNTCVKQERLNREHGGPDARRQADGD